MTARKIKGIHRFIPAVANITDKDRIKNNLTRNDLIQRNAINSDRMALNASNQFPPFS